MAAAAAVSIITIVEAALPGAIAIWNAIKNFRSANPSLGPDQINAMVKAMDASITSLDQDTLNALSQIK